LLWQQPARRVKTSASTGQTKPQREALDTVGTFLVAKPQAGTDL
jgi:hypothetical protein